MFKGIYAALITPFDENGIKYEALFELVDYLIKKGVNGLFITGTTSEVMSLSLDERKKICSTVLKANNKRVNTIMQIGNCSLKDSIELGFYAKENGVDAVSLVSPIYHRYSVKEIVDYYKTVSTILDMPWLAYNIPCCTGVDLLNDEYREIFKLKKCVGVKASTLNIYSENKLKRDFSDLSILHGSDECLLGSIVLGADGAVGSTYNLIPEYFQLMLSFLKIDIDKSLYLQNACNDLIDCMNRFGLSALKYLIGKRTGINCGTCRSPIRELTAENKNELDKEYERFILKVKDFE